MPLGRSRDAGSVAAIAAAAAATLLAVAIGHEMLTSRLTAGRVAELAGITVLGGLGFVVVGLAVVRRPLRRRVGVLMLTVGFAWMIGGLRWADGGRLAVTIGAFGGWLWAALLGQLVLGFPEG